MVWTSISNKCIIAFLDYCIDRARLAASDYVGAQMIANSVVGPLRTWY
jgi:hypothetical protein